MAKTKTKHMNASQCHIKIQTSEKNSHAQHPTFSLPETAGAFFRLRHFVLYEDYHRTRLFLVGSDATKRRYRIMKIEKRQISAVHASDAECDGSQSTDLEVHIDPSVYSAQKMKDLLAMLSEASKRRIVEKKVKKKSRKKKKKEGSKLHDKKEGDVPAEEVAEEVVEEEEVVMEEDSVDESNVAKRNRFLTATSTNTRGGLRLRLRAHGVMGFIRFTRGYYAVVITQCEKVGRIGPHTVYGVRDTAFVPLFNSSSQVGLFKSDEQRYREIFQTLDLSRDIYFSYTYDLSQTLQHNMTTGTTRRQQDQNTSNEFVWNAHLLKPFFSCRHNSDLSQLQKWVMPVIHGYYGQRHVSVFNRVVNLLLIARRSRFYAGTRYLKRGLNDHGHVANHVETEQIVFESNALSKEQRQGCFSSIVQVRGSIPLHWSQTIATKVVNPKPEPIFTKLDPMFTSSRRHFDRLLHRYGSPNICLDLIKQHEKKPRERPLGKAFRECIEFLNDTVHGNDETANKLVYIAWDFKRATKDSPEKLLNELSSIAEEALDKTSIFCSKSHIAPEGYSLQKGVLRTNCIDCLDRTNIAQFFFGKQALGTQLHAIGISDSPFLIHHDEFVRDLMSLYETMGDKIALQYGGSATVSAGINHRGRGWDWATSLKRYYSNNFKDEHKQGAMNLFLGTYRTDKNLPKLWDLETDLYLHEMNLGEDEQHDGISDFDALVQPPASNKEEEEDREHLFAEEFYKPFEMESMDDLLPNKITLSRDQKKGSIKLQSDIQSEHTHDLQVSPNLGYDLYDTSDQVEHQRLHRDAESLSIEDTSVEDGSDEFSYDSSLHGSPWSSKSEALHVAVEQEPTTSMDSQPLSSPQSSHSSKRKAKFRFGTLQRRTLPQRLSNDDTELKFKSQTEVQQSMEALMSNNESDVFRVFSRRGTNLLERNVAADEAIYIKTNETERQAFTDYTKTFDNVVDKHWLVTDGMIKNDHFDITTQVSPTSMHFDRTTEQLLIVCDESFQQKDFYASFIDSYTRGNNLGTLGIRNSDLLVYQNYCDEVQNNNKDQKEEVVDNEDAARYREYLRSMRSVAPSHFLRATNEAVQRQLQPYQCHRLQETCEPIGTHFDEMRRFFPHLRTNEMILCKLKDVISRMKQEIHIADRIRYLSPTRRLFNKFSLYELLKARVYQKCFVGSTAVDWIVENNIIVDEEATASSAELQSEESTVMKKRQKATDFLATLLRANVLHDVRLEDEFHDNYLLYRFAEHDKIRVLNLMLETNQIQSSVQQPSISASESLTPRESVSMEQRNTVDPLMLSFDLIIKAVKLLTYYWKLPSNYHTGGRYNGGGIGGPLGNNRIPLVILKQISSQEIVRMANNSLFQVFVHETEKLKMVDLTQMSKMEKTCFFINIFNVLYLHGMMLQGGFGNRMTGSNTLAMAFFRRTAYQISGMLFTLQDIRDGILRGNKLFPQSFTRPFEKDDDLRLSVAFRHNTDKDSAAKSSNANIADSDIITSAAGFLENPRFDPRIFFVLSSFHSASLFFVHPDNLEQVLERETERFLGNNVSIDFKSRTIRLPSLFQKFMSDFVRVQQPVPSTSTEAWTTLLRGMLPWLSRTHPLRNDIGQLLQEHAFKIASYTAVFFNEYI